MLTEADLAILWADFESDRVERKASITDGDRIRQAICAFANDMPDHRLPGVLFIGANDDGSCANLPITDRLLQTLASMRSDGNILPFPSMTAQKRTVDACEVAVVEVQPSYTPPVRYNGRVWIRVGPRAQRRRPMKNVDLPKSVGRATCPSINVLFRARPSMIWISISFSGRTCHRPYRRTFWPKTTGRFSNSSLHCISSHEIACRMSRQS